MRLTLSPCCSVIFLSAALATFAGAQQTTATELGSPIPVITGDFSFQTTIQPGLRMIMPEFDPVILLPIGNKVLVEAEYDIFPVLTDDSGTWGPAVVNHKLEYLQLNYIATSFLTFTVGRFLTPFGIFRERLHPMWIRNIAADPLIFPMNDNSSNGVMARGSARVAQGVDLTYSSYFSTVTRNNQLPADRRAGLRASLFLPDKHLEIGVSFARVLGDTHYSQTGGDISWSPRKAPVDFRAEYEQTRLLGKGYWVEAAYHLSQLGGNSFLRNSLFALRQEQYWAPSTTQNLIDALPDRNTIAPTLGYTYTLYNGFRFNASYGRNFATSQHFGVWALGLTYRFAIL